MDSLERMWQRTSPPNGDTRRPSRKDTGGMRRIIIAGITVLALIILLNMTKGFYTEWLWFKDLGYDSIYGTILGTKVLVFFVSALLFLLLFLGNIALAMRFTPKIREQMLPWAFVSQLQRFSRWSVVAGAVLISLIFGMVAQDQ